MVFSAEINILFLYYLGRQIAEPPKFEASHTPMKMMLIQITSHRNSHIYLGLGLYIYIYSLCEDKNLLGMNETDIVLLPPLCNVQGCTLQGSTKTPVGFPDLPFRKENIKSL